MRIGTLLKCVAAVVVLGILAFICALTWHVAVEPVSTVLNQVIPTDAGTSKVVEAVGQELAAVSEEIPEIDPAEPLFEKATEQMAMAHMEEARLKLRDLVRSFPRSPKSVDARRILGEMNLDEWLSNQSPTGKVAYRVKPGDSYYAIAAREGTTLENLMHLNGLMELPGLRPGNELILMPLNFQLVVDLGLKTLSIWSGESFVCEFPMLSHPAAGKKLTGKTVIESKIAMRDGKRVLAGGDGYAEAAKILILKSPAIRIFSQVADDGAQGGAIGLSVADMETLNLLVRVGNSVEFR